MGQVGGLSRHWQSNTGLDPAYDSASLEDGKDQRDDTCDRAGPHDDQDEQRHTPLAEHVRFPKLVTVPDGPGSMILARKGGG